jgi:hypothetical protein
MSKLAYPQDAQNIKICEICGSKFIAGYGYSLMACWVVTGHAYVGAFTCSAPGGQHWGCTPEHAVEACFACIEEHMHPKLKALHQEQTDNGKPRAAVEDEHLLEKGENFHIL